MHTGVRGGLLCGVSGISRILALAFATVQGSQRPPAVSKEIKASSAWALRFSVLLTTILVTACGGGGGGGGNSGNGGGGGGYSPPAVTAPSGLAYTAPPALVIQQAMTPLSPTVTGQVTSYSVSPALPAGLSLNVSTGAISGTPTMAAAAATYTVTASNSAGSTTANVSITVLSSAPTIAYASQIGRAHV